MSWIIEIMIFTSCSQICWYSPRPAHTGLCSKTRCSSPCCCWSLLIVPHEKQLILIVKLGKTVIVARQLQTVPKTATWRVRNVQRCTYSVVPYLTNNSYLWAVAAVTCTKWQQSPAHFRYMMHGSPPFSWLRNTFSDFKIENYKRKNYPLLFLFLPIFIKEPPLKKSFIKKKLKKKINKAL